MGDVRFLGSGLNGDKERMAASGPLGAAYDRAEFMNQRRKMMSQWADYLDHLRLGKPGVPPRTPTTRRRGARDLA